MIAVNMLMSEIVLSRLDAAFLAGPRRGGTLLSAVGSGCAVTVAVGAPILTLLVASGVGRTGQLPFFKW